VRKVEKKLKRVIGTFIPSAKVSNARNGKERHETSVIQLRNEPRVTVRPHSPELKHNQKMHWEDACTGTLPNAEMYLNIPTLDTI
jgi:hypothetical protein